MVRRGRKRKAAPETAPPKDTGVDDLSTRIIDSTMELVAGRGWRNVALSDIASASGLSLARLYAIFPSKLAVLDAFERRISERTLAEGTDPKDPVRDRLFELVMRRLDALKPYKPGVRALLADLPRDPAIVLCAGPRFLNAMRWMGEAAGVDTNGIGGVLRVKGLAAIYLATLRTWLEDDSEDQAKTMAALDRALKRAEMFVQSVPGFRRRPAAGAA